MTPAYPRKSSNRSLDGIAELERSNERPTRHCAHAEAPRVGSAPPILRRNCNRRLTRRLPRPRGRCTFAPRRPRGCRRSWRRSIGIVCSSRCGRILAKAGGRLPDPVSTWHSAVDVFSNPFYKKGPNDQGHRLERAHVARPGRHRLRGSGACRHSPGIHDRVSGSSPTWRRRSSAS